eukprot:scaffold116373_cov28-Tisochrysis_lutea.AAC.1
MIFGCRVFADLSYGSWHVAVVRRRRVVSVSGARCGYVLGEPFGEAVRFCYEPCGFAHSYGGLAGRGPALGWRAAFELDFVALPASSAPPFILPCGRSPSR